MALNGLFCADVPLRNYSLTVLVYLQPFWRNSLLKSVLQPKIMKNSQ